MQVWRPEQLKFLPRLSDRVSLVNPVNVNWPAYDPVLLTSGILGGGSQSYNFRLDLRVVYQAVCNNYPRPDEAAFPLWQGLPANNSLTRAELAARIGGCTGVRHKKADHSPAQQHNFTTIVDVIRIPESSLVGHLNWAILHFQDVVFNRLMGATRFASTKSGNAARQAMMRSMQMLRATPQAVQRGQTSAQTPTCKPESRYPCSPCTASTTG